MKILKSKADCFREIEIWKKSGKSIGFVPTMGALHEGHLSLVEKSSYENDITIVSIFVNPTQFNDKKDLEKYPRNLDNDAGMLAPLNVDAIFAPSVNEMYPKDDIKKEYDLGGLDQYMEGLYRPGHFQGVAMVIDRLFQIICADNAYFGEKDFQQLAIIRYIAKTLGFKINVVGCPIVRDIKGLALSSRNELLNEECKKNAPKIFEALQLSAKEIVNIPLEEVKKNVVKTLNRIPCFKVEYFEIVGANNLRPIKEFNKNVKTVGCIAVWADNVRLIDNVIYNS